MTNFSEFIAELVRNSEFSRLNSETEDLVSLLWLVEDQGLSWAEAMSRVFDNN